ncbi:MAG: sigma-70 family RNA polymerase sigma factor [Prevotella sp.]|jgi:RNA polymerase sigma factor (sigma-70 family)|nr:sigma-70 family RNA polymerase sigma factor [Prevotella sp.]
MEYNVTDNPEPLLWNKFLSGDDEAYALIYKQYVQILFSYALQFTSDRELIKDCIQDVFEKLHKNRTKLKQTDNVKVYLFVILKNSLINVLKKEQAYLQYIGEIEGDPSESETASDKLEESEDDKNVQHIVRQVFAVLTPRQKEIMFYRYIEGLEIKDIASIMEMNYQSVQNLIQRSIKKARECL